MAEKSTTYVIKDGAGKKVREQTVVGDFSPVLQQGERAEVKEAPKPKPEAPAAPAPDPKPAA